jgi:hypothetical protein
VARDVHRRAPGISGCHLRKLNSRALEPLR